MAAVDLFIVDENSDEAWIARARAKASAAGGKWDISPSLERPPPPRPQPVAATMGVGWRCPSCPGEREMGVFARPDAPSRTPLVYCSGCFGFWAAGDALSAGLQASDARQPALRAKPVAQACRQCAKPLNPMGICPSCGWTLTPLRCPLCKVEMRRLRHQTVTLDHCEPCRGVWFDASEIARVYELDRPAAEASPAARMAGQRSASGTTRSGNLALPAAVDLGMLVLRGLFRL